LPCVDALSVPILFTYCEENRKPRALQVQSCLKHGKTPEVSV
jgi:hypothetical protein